MGRSPRRRAVAANGSPGGGAAATGKGLGAAGELKGVAGSYLGSGLEQGGDGAGQPREQAAAVSKVRGGGAANWERGSWRWRGVCGA